MDDYSVFQIAQQNFIFIYLMENISKILFYYISTSNVQVITNVK